MSGLRSALRVEVRKAASAVALRVGGAILASGTAVLAAALVAATRAGNEQITAKLGPFAEATGWELLVVVAAQVVAAGALLAFGVTLGWTFGREFTDGTVNGLLAIPVSRSAIVAAKLLVHLLWTVLVAALLTAFVIGSGLITGLGAIDAATAASLVRLFALTVLTGLIATPAAWAATLGRGPLPGVATAVGLIVIAQIAVVAFPAQGAWLPVAAPALWAVQPTGVTGVQLLLAPVFALAFAVVTVRAWQRLQVDH